MTNNTETDIDTDTDTRIHSVRVHDVVQITDERPGLKGAFFLVTEVRSWGAQGFIHHVASFEESHMIFLRLRWDQFEVIGRAVLVSEDQETDGEQ